MTDVHTDGNGVAGLLGEILAVGGDGDAAPLPLVRRREPARARTAPTTAPASCCAARRAPTSRCASA